MSVFCIRSQGTRAVVNFKQPTTALTVRADFGGILKARNPEFGCGHYDTVSRYLLRILRRIKVSRSFPTIGVVHAFWRVFNPPYFCKGSRRPVVRPASEREQDAPNSGVGCSHFWVALFLRAEV